MKHVNRLSLPLVMLTACIGSAEAVEGTVEFFNESGGYGYVTDNETDETYIFEAADINGSVTEGDAVTFTVTTEDDRFSVKAQAVALSEAQPAAGDDAVDETDDVVAAGDVAGEDPAETSAEDPNDPPEDPEADAAEEDGGE